MITCIVVAGLAVLVAIYFLTGVVFLVPALAGLAEWEPTGIEDGWFD